MKSLVVAATVIALTVGFVTYTKYTDDKLEGQFADFITQFNKNYGSVEEYAFRFEAYKNNLETIERLNAKNPEAKFEINQFGDFTKDDMKKLWDSEVSKLKMYNMYKQLELLQLIGVECGARSKIKVSAEPRGPFQAQQFLKQDMHWRIYIKL